MKKKLETEVTFFTPDFSLDTQQLIEDMHKKSEENPLTVLKYNDRIQMLYEDKEHDKKKITFKINHGDLYYSIATKDRLTSTSEIIQSYQECKTAWTPIEEFDLSIFNSRILAFYYKELKRISIAYQGRKYKINGHDVQFLNLNCEVKQKMKYVEIESKSFEYDHINFFVDYFRNHKLDLLDHENSKWNIGKKILSDEYQLQFMNIVDLRKYVLDLYTAMSVYHLA